MQTFIMPRDVYHGHGALTALRRLNGQRALLVTGVEAMRRNGFLQRAQHFLREAGLETTIYSGIARDASEGLLLAGVKVMRERKPDWVVALGGGAVLDAAKLMCVLYEHPGLALDNLIQPEGLPWMRRMVRLAAVSTTLGGGSAVSAYAVLPRLRGGLTRSVSDSQLVPDMAIFDPDLPIMLPRSQTVAGGIGTLTLAVEAYASGEHSDLTDPLALQAIHLFADALQGATEGSPSACERMQYASCLAALAASNASMGLAHTLALALSAAFYRPIPYGHAAAMCLPAAIRSGAGVSGARYAALARHLRLGAGGAPALAKWVQDWCARLELAPALRAYGAVEAEFLAKAPALAGHVIEQLRRAQKPGAVTQKEVEELLRSIYYGG
ncbi:MAG: iron-containing alcohol dehydrogenase [Christensenellaceae bacterium]|jgi:alcohol dehydrogenase class IV|nr:iron-containing alcohol dehydrogenase [Christensenellaceae bacterium]